MGEFDRLNERPGFSQEEIVERLRVAREQRAEKQRRDAQEQEARRLRAADASARIVEQSRADDERRESERRVRKKAQRRAERPVVGPMMLLLGIAGAFLVLINVTGDAATAVGITLALCWLGAFSMKRH